MQNPVLNRVWRLFFAKPTITTLKLRHISYLHSSFYLINLIGFPERFSLISAFVYFHASLGTSLIAFSDKSSSTKLVSLRKARGSISTGKKIVEKLYRPGQPHLEFGNTQCGISGFFYHSDFTWNQLWWFQYVNTSNV